VALEAGGGSSLNVAAGALAGTLYERAVGESATLEQAQRAVAACVVMQVRVLGAWLPRTAVSGLRALAAWFELANLEDRLAYFAGADAPAPFDLGILSSAWEAASASRDATELRGVLASSSWGDPGSDDADAIHLALRFGWARRVAEQAPEAAAWAAGAIALLLAEELFIAHRPVAVGLVRRAGFQPAAAEAVSLAELRARLPRRAAWVLEEVETPEQLWRAELAWMRRVEAEAEAMTRSGLAGRQVAVGAVTLLGIDAMRITTALAAAAQDGARGAREVLDALG
jgi:hypothetical protein